jgi:hypothetical protein
MKRTRRQAVERICLIQPIVARQQLEHQVLPGEGGDPVAAVPDRRIMQ